MSALGRIVLGFLSVAWIAACGGLIALAWNGDRKLDIETSDFDLEAFIVADDAEKWFFTVIVALLALLGVFAFILALKRTDRAPKGALRLKQADGGTVEVTTAALESLVAAEMLELPDVHSANARVRLKGNRVATDLLLGIGGQVSIANVTAAAGTKLNEVFRDQVGVVDVRRPLVRIEYDGTPGTVERNNDPLPAPPLTERRLSYDQAREAAPTMPPRQERDSAEIGAPTTPPPASSSVSLPPRPAPDAPDTPADQPSTSSVTLPPPPAYPHEARNDDD